MPLLRQFWFWDVLKKNSESLKPRFNRSCEFISTYHPHDLKHEKHGFKNKYQKYGNVILFYNKEEALYPVFTADDVLPSESVINGKKYMSVTTERNTESIFYHMYILYKGNVTKKALVNKISNEFPFLIGKKGLKQGPNSNYYMFNEGAVTKDGREYYGLELPICKGTPFVAENFYFFGKEARENLKGYGYSIETASGKRVPIADYLKKYDVSFVKVRIQPMGDKVMTSAARKMQKLIDNMPAVEKTKDGVHYGVKWKANHIDKLNNYGYNPKDTSLHMYQANKHCSKKVLDVYKNNQYVCVKYECGLRNWSYVIDTYENRGKENQFGICNW